MAHEFAVIMQLLMFSKKYIILNIHVQRININRKKQAVKLNIFYNSNFITNIYIYEERKDKYPQNISRSHSEGAI